MLLKLLNDLPAGANIGMFFVAMRCAQSCCVRSIGHEAMLLKLLNDLPAGAGTETFSRREEMGYSAACNSMIPAASQPAGRMALKS